MGVPFKLPYQPQPPAAPPRPDALPGPYATSLSSNDETQFQTWVKTNRVPWQDGPQSDYDLRGYWKAKQSGDPNAKQAANQHFPDTWKTPYHATFSNQSQYALPIAPHWKGNTLLDHRGNVVYQERK